MKTIEPREDVFRRYGAELTRFATSLVGPSDAQDVVSEAFISCVWSPRWPTVDNQRAYLYRSVLHQARSNHRAATRRWSRESDVALPPRTESPEGQVDVWEALAHLSPLERAVVFLTYWEDLTRTEAAQRLGLSERTVRRRLDHARQSLRKLLQ